MNSAVVRDTIVKWLSDQLKESGQKGFVVGISGGVDSALVSKLCALTGEHTWLVSIPIHQALDQVKRGRDHMNKLSRIHSNVHTYAMDITETLETFKGTFPESMYKNDLVMANTRARLRMTVLYAFAGQYKLLVAGTGNKVEDYGIGFFTKYGDGGVDISPIGDLSKTEVWKLAKFVRVSDDIVRAKPMDGLWTDNRGDEDVIGATYPELEWAMDTCNHLNIDSEKDYEELKRWCPKHFFSDNQERLLHIYLSMHEKSRHKMKVPPVCHIRQWMMTGELKKVRIRTTYVWQCQDCGDYNHRSTSGEPRRCTTCGGKGVQTYKGTLAEIKKRKE